MVKFQNDCCECAAPGYPCLGSSCPKQNVKHYYCDACKDEVEKLYEFDNKQLCIDCIEKRLERVK